MTETPWMKGPWWVEKRGMNTWQVQTAHRGPDSSFCIAVLNDWTEGAEATARLMAAAPEMAEALKLARAFIVNGIELGYIRMPEEKDDPAHKTLPEIDAALEKAGAKL